MASADAKKRKRRDETAPAALRPLRTIEETTHIVEGEVLSDLLETELLRLDVDYEGYLNVLWEANPEIHELLRTSTAVEEARDRLFSYLERTERELFAVDNRLHILEKATVRDAIRVYKSILGPINEKRTGFSALDCLWKLASNQRDKLSTQVSMGFIMEFIHLFRGVAGRSNIYREDEVIKRGIPEFLQMTGREAAVRRTEMLDDMGATLRQYFKRFPSGLDPEVRSWRRQNRQRILRYLGGSEEDWNDHVWHLKHVIKSAKVVADLIDLKPEQRDAIAKAIANRVPFGITPYYISLMDRNPSIGYDHAVRAQVLPPPDFVNAMVDHKTDRASVFDFMGEHDTSPIDLVTRRYPLICILKPFNTCSQICVYCQRNWEIDECMAEGAAAPWEDVKAAIDWIGEHPAIGDVLITGGDPAIMTDKAFDRLLSHVAALDHVYRIRIGTRTPVVLPQRFTDSFLEILGRYHVPGRREIAIITHFEHPYEITPEAMAAVQKIRRLGIGVYNQEVFTIENSRRFEAAKLRHDLRIIGVDPYYKFNMKGKVETRRLMVPIARILQEAKEEARLLPGLDRTDEPVFNVPRLGKNHLRAMQDHRLVMVLPNGGRVYEFHPWEKNISPMPPYNYVDVPIYDYLEELAKRGENIRDYRTIWYYY